MPRGAKLTPEVEELIVSVCIEHPEWLAKPLNIQQEVINRLPERLKAWGGPDWPGIDVIKNRLRKYIRPKLENIPSKSKRLNEPWSLGSLDDLEYKIPSDALPAVLRVWKWCIALGPGHPFTVHHAIWVSRLCSVIADIADLYHWAGVYVHGEHTAQIMGKTFDSSNIDTALVMNSWEWATALFVRELAETSHYNSDYGRSTLSSWVKCGNPESYDLTAGRHCFPAYIKHKGWPEASIIKMAESEVIGTIENRIIPDTERGTLRGRDLDIQKLITDYREQFNSDDLESALKEESKWVYVHWLLCLSRGPKWQVSTATECLDVIKQLRNWISRHEWSKTGIYPGFNQFNKEDLYNDPKFKPTYLLRKVGYDV